MNKVLARVGLLIALLSTMGWAGRPAQAQGQAPRFPRGFFGETIVTGLDLPTAIDWASDGRMFIALKDGEVKIVQDGQLLPDDFIDISAQVNTYWDHGLMGIAVHPSFPNPPYIYLLFTYDPPDLPGQPYAVDGPDGGGERVSRLVRVSASAANPNVADPNSLAVILGKNSTLENIGDPAAKDGLNAPPSCIQAGRPVPDCIPSDGPSHTVGTVRFAPDGSLYVGTGEGTPFFNPEARALRAQDLDQLSGKIMRINPETGQGYPDNPFYDGNPDSNRSRVWDEGLRNPFRFTLHPVTGEIYISDVGWYAWEEINSGKGKDFGWPCYEGGATGSVPQSSYQYFTGTASFCADLYTRPDAVQAPLYAYTNTAGIGAAAIVGDIYSATAYPAEYQGVLFIADYNRDTIFYLTLQDGVATPHAFASDVSGEGGPVQLRLGPDGLLYYVVLSQQGPGDIRRINFSASGNTPPTAQIEAAPDSGMPPLTVHFTGTNSYDPEGDPLAYRWDFGDAFTATTANPTHIYTTTGDYPVTLRVIDPQGASGTADFKVSVGNTAPVAGIVLTDTVPGYNVGDTVHFQSTARDAEDGLLTGKSLYWEVIIHHNEHTHYDFFEATGTEGSFVIPDHGDHTGLELCLTASDQAGLQGKACVPIPLNVATSAFETRPAGLLLVYDGISATAPFTAASAVDSQRLVIAPLLQGDWQFVSWSDGDPAGHTIHVPAGYIIYRATYRWYIQLPLLLPAAASPSSRG